MQTIREYVNDYANDHNTTRDAIAAKAEIGRSSFYAKLRGASEFTLPEAYRLSKVIGCTIDELYSMTVMN